MFEEAIAHVTCACEKVFQVLNEAGDDLDLDQTMADYNAHQAKCPGAPPAK